MQRKKETQTLQSIRGMRDLFSEEGAWIRAAEDRILECVRQYGYQLIQTPILEPYELFFRAVGKETDIVQKEMYTFSLQEGADADKDRLTLRPEGTAGCVRAGIQHGLFRHQVQRWSYSGPMFRKERPQKGRYRQFHQIGVENFGMMEAEADFEMLALSRDCLAGLGLMPWVQLEINSLGNVAARQRYLDVLRKYLQQTLKPSGGDLLQRMVANPLRVLDSKDPEVQAQLAQAPQLLEYLCADCLKHFEALRSYLDRAGIQYRVSPRLVRGLDYYNRTVFEWTTDHLGTQGTLCAGGRYDDLVAGLGGPSTPAVGFAMGLERIILLGREKKSFDPRVPFSILVASPQEAPRFEVLQFAQDLRKQHPHWRILQYYGQSLSKQLKWGEHHGAGHAFLIPKNFSLPHSEIGLKRFDTHEIFHGQIGACIEQVALWQGQVFS